MSVEDRVRLLEERVYALEKLIASSESTNYKNTQKKTLSLREYINKLRPSTANDIALVISHYYEAYKDSGFFTGDDIKHGFNQAKIIAPKNISDVMAKNAKKGYIMPDEKNPSRTKAWVLTNTGEEYIQELSENRG